MAFLRERLARHGVLPCDRLGGLEDRTARLRRRPGPGAPEARHGERRHFITLEDETGIANLVVWPKVFDAHRRIVMSASLLGCQGRLQVEASRRIRSCIWWRIGCSISRPCCARYAGRRADEAAVARADEVAHTMAATRADGSPRNPQPGFPLRYRRRSLT